MQSIGGLEFSNSTPKVISKRPEDENERGKKTWKWKNQCRKKSSISIGVVKWRKGWGRTLGRNWCSPSSAARSPDPVSGGDKAHGSRHGFAKSGLAEIKKDILNVSGEEGNSHLPRIWNQMSGPHKGGRASLEVRSRPFLSNTECCTHWTANEVWVKNWASEKSVWVDFPRSYWRMRE